MENGQKSLEKLASFLCVRIDRILMPGPKVVKVVKVVKNRPPKVESLKVVKVAHTSVEVVCYFIRA